MPVNARAKILSMAPGRRSEDDRGDAPGWYARLKIHQRCEELGIKQEKVADDSGVASASISTCMTSGKGIGTLQIVRLAEYFRMPPGRFLDDALLWWEHQGRDHARAVRVAVAEGRGAPKKPTSSDKLVAVSAPTGTNSSTPPPGSTERGSARPRRAK